MDFGRFMTGFLVLTGIGESNPLAYFRPRTVHQRTLPTGSMNQCTVYSTFIPIYLLLNQVPRADVWLSQPFRPCSRTVEQFKSQP